MNALPSLLLGLRDGLRPTLILHALGWLMAVLMGWFGLFAVVDDEWWSLATLTAHVQAHTQLDAAFAGILAAMLFTFSYVLLVLTSMALVILFVLMPRIRQVCLASYPSLSPSPDAGGLPAIVAPVRHALWLVGAAVAAGALSWVLPGVGSLAGLALMAYANTRGLVMDALDGLASPAEQAAVLRQQRGATLLMGLVLPLLALVPVLGLLSLFIMGPSASHLAFRALMQQRGLRA